MKRRFRESLRQVLAVDDTPHRIALAFAIGVFIAMSALLGLHTILGLAIAHLMRLSKRVMLVGVYVNNPWTMVPIFTFCVWIGLLFTGGDAKVPAIDWGNLSLKSLMNDCAHLILPFVVGTTVVGIVSAVAGYVMLKQAVIRYRKPDAT
ncbi:MAG: DUF2062 domain-containing protein [Nitrospirae bacterium]|nr:DUF2062 domain-containing protein [Nitrospirota bacterium]